MKTIPHTKSINWHLVRPGLMISFIFSDSNTLEDSTKIILRISTEKNETTQMKTCFSFLDANYFMPPTTRNFPFRVIDKLS